MRAVFFVVAVLIVCGAVSRSIWLKSRTIVDGYDVRKLRDAAADLRTDNDKVRADIAVLATMRSIERAAKNLKLDLVAGAPETVTMRRRAVSGVKN